MHVVRRTSTPNHRRCGILLVVGVPTRVQAVCAMFRRSGACPNFERLGHCMFDHPPSVHVLFASTMAAAASAVGGPAAATILSGGDSDDRRSARSSRQSSRHSRQSSAGGSPGNESQGQHPSDSVMLGDIVGSVPSLPFEFAVQLEEVMCCRTVNVVLCLSPPAVTMARRPRHLSTLCGVTVLWLIHVAECNPTASQRRRQRQYQSVPQQEPPAVKTLVMGRGRPIFGVCTAAWPVLYTLTARHHASQPRRTAMATTTNHLTTAPR